MIYLSGYMLFWYWIFLILFLYAGNLKMKRLEAKGIVSSTLILSFLEFAGKPGFCLPATFDFLATFTRVGMWLRFCFQLWYEWSRPFGVVRGWYGTWRGISQTLLVSEEGVTYSQASVVLSLCFSQCSICFVFLRNYKLMTMFVW
jgi:hypothetical protein